jgi:hypothetical protein
MRMELGHTDLRGPFLVFVFNVNSYYYYTTFLGSVWCNSPKLQIQFKFVIKTLTKVGLEFLVFEEIHSAQV